MKPYARRKARRLALQALYQWHVSGEDIYEIERQFKENANPKKVDIEYFSELLKEITNNVEAIDQKIQPILDRDIAKINPVELAILRIAIYEFENRLDIPYRVIINEALESAKAFGAEASFKYVNGVLDKAAKTRTDYEKQ